MSDVFTDEDLQKAETHPTLGPAYFAARRMAEALMAGTESSPFNAVVKKCVDEIQTAVYEYAEDWMRDDMENNLRLYMSDMVERTVKALLTGEEWAMRQYPLSQYHDGEKIREAVAKHGGDVLLMARIADLEKEVARLTESLKWYQRP
jgi:hypothetical protein